MKSENGLSISIPNPCHESWEGMTKQDNGRFCNSCSKVVVDFTTMSNQEVLLYFKNHSASKTCGHFYQKQINVQPNGFHQYLLNAYCKAYTIKYSAARVVAMAAISLVLTLTGCNGIMGKASNDNVRTTGDTVAYKPVDSLTVTGKMAAPADTIHHTKKNCNKQ